MTPIAQVIGLVFVVGSAALGIPLVSECLHTSLVPRFPTVILATGVAAGHAELRDWPVTAYGDP